MSPGEQHLPDRDGPAEEEHSYPIGFKIAVGLTALYLIYRLFQGVAWLIARGAG